jgi:hypothetical protein
LNKKYRLSILGKVGFRLAIVNQIGFLERYDVNLTGLCELLKVLFGEFLFLQILIKKHILLFISKKVNPK